MKITKNTYPDGSFYPIVELEHNINDKFLTFRINDYNDLWFLTQIKDALDNLNHHDYILTIPCLLDGQADRRFEDSSSSNLRLLCRHINSLGFSEIRIFHPHNQEVVEALIDNVKFISNESFIKDVLQNITDNYISNIEDNLIILAPDAGAYKWIPKLCDKLDWKGELLSASKSRYYGGGKSFLKHEIPNYNYSGKNVLILDDIIIGGGSMTGLINLLKEEGANMIFCAASHITIPNPNPVLFDLSTKVYTTNSKNLDYVTRDDFPPKNLQVIKMFKDEIY